MLAMFGRDGVHGRPSFYEGALELVGGEGGWWCVPMTTLNLPRSGQ